MYFYHANAVGLAGEISRPFQETIPAQAATCLAPTGGIASSEIRNFQLKNVLSFRRAAVRVAGSFDPDRQQHNTMAQATVEGLSVLDVVTADRIVANLSAAASSRDAEPRITASGSYFENLRIFGKPAEAEFASSSFEQYNTFERFSDAVKLRDENARSLLVGNNLESIKPGDHPSLERLKKAWEKQVYSQKRDRFYWATLVRSIERTDPSIRNYGSILVVPNFGLIHLAEFLIQHGQRQLNMLRFELGSPVGGSIVAACASCNGLAGDPTTDD